MVTQQVIHPRPIASIITQKVQLTYKLFLLESARKTLEQELNNLTNKVYEEVQGFLNSSLPTISFTDLAKALDLRCQAVDQLSALMKELTVGTHICVKNGLRTKQLEPPGHKRVTLSDVLNFRPLLPNSLRLSSISKADQLRGATLSVQQLNSFLVPKTAVAQKDVTICSITPRNISADVTPNSPSIITEKQHIVSEENHAPDSVHVSPTIILQIGPDRPPFLLPPMPTIFTEIGNPRPAKITQVLNWGCLDDVTLLHQKQTSSQLLQLLKAKSKNKGRIEVMEWSKEIKGMSQLISSAAKTQNHQVRHVSDGVIDTQVPKSLSAYVANRAPVFKIKKGESGGSLIYAYMTATKTELWDIGDIFTEVAQEDLEPSALENQECGNVKHEMKSSCLNVHVKAKTQQKTQPDHKDASARMSTINGLTIPEFQIRRFEEAEVVVSHIVSPGNFYIQQADSIKKLQALVTDSLTASCSYAEQNMIPDIGSKVMGWFPEQKQWCRVQVTKICGVSEDNIATGDAVSETSIKVEVKRLDHGDTACLSLWNVKELTPELATLPLQAIQVSLANVTPVNGSSWSEEAIDWFHAIVHNRTLYARLFPQGSAVTAELFLEKGRLGIMRRGASLSVRLAQNGHAKHRNGSFIKRGTVQAKMRKEDTEWEKYLILCCTQIRK